MKRLMSLIALLLLANLVYATPVSAARAKNPKVYEPVGYDISYPQCNKKLPTTFEFAVVGVNGGNAATANPCLTEQLRWAKAAKGKTAQPSIQLYVNTANPGEIISEVKTWPENDIDLSGNNVSDFIVSNPHGPCNGDNTLACSWLYGWNRAIYSAEKVFKPAARAAGVSDEIRDYTWWFDVETMNTWQSPTPIGQANNAATLEGMAAYYTHLMGAKIGLYSTHYQWGTITGMTQLEILKNLPTWRPSGTNLNIAKDNCREALPLTEGSYVSMTQYIVQNLDRNHSCL